MKIQLSFWEAAADLLIPGRFFLLGIVIIGLLLIVMLRGDAGLSLAIEISQLFTLHRATDINDLLTNVIGTGIGYFCFAIAVVFGIVKPYSRRRIAERECFKYLPYLIMAIAYLMEFIS